MIEFFVSCVPPTTTSQQKRAARTAAGIRFFKDSRLQTAQDSLLILFKQHQPKTPLKAPIELTIEATWPWRSGDLNSKAKRASAETVGREPMTEKPDADNLAKLITDVLSMLRFIEDDKGVSCLTVRKWRGSEPGVFIRVASL